MADLRQAAQQALEALEMNYKLINGEGSCFGLEGAMDGYYSGCFDIDGTNKLTNKTMTALRAALAQQEQAPVADAMKTVTKAMQDDPDYAWSWHCNVAMAFVDAGGDSYTANQGAARFMRLLANVDPAHELPSHPPRREWRSLSEEEILPLYNTTPSSHAEMLEFARDIEAKLKEKNQ
jgi:hypothetical protein